MRRERGSNLKFRAVIKKSEDWWIGWLVDLPGVKAQEKSKDELIQSLKAGAEDMLLFPVQPEEEFVSIGV